MGCGAERFGVNVDGSGGRRWEANSSRDSRDRYRTASRGQLPRGPNGLARTLVCCAPRADLFKPEQSPDGDPAARRR